MKKNFFYFILLGVACSLSAVHRSACVTAQKEEKSIMSAPWTQPRLLSNFQTLLQHSPFSLASAEESSPLSERYAITGVITLDGEDEVFIFDRNDQSRELVTKKPNEKQMSLIAIIPQSDPSKLKATVSIKGETGTLSELELSTNKPSIGAAHYPSPYGASKGNLYPPGTHFPPPKNGTSYPSYPPASYPPSSNHPGSYPGTSYAPPPHYPSAMPHVNEPRAITRPPIPNPSANKYATPVDGIDDF